MATRAHVHTYGRTTLLQRTLDAAVEKSIQGHGDQCEVLQQFQSKCVTYARISTTRHHSYIGMTTITFAKRENARRRKYSSLRRGRWVNCEPALRWWANTRSYFNFTPVVLQVLPDKTAALIQETTLIQAIQPSLHKPMIKQFFTKNSFGQRAKFTMPSSKLNVGTRGLWKRVRQQRKGHPWLRITPSGDNFDNH